MKGHTIHVKKMHLPRGMNRTKGGSRFDTVAAVVHRPHSPGGRGLTSEPRSCRSGSPAFSVALSFTVVFHSANLGLFQLPRLRERLRSKVREATERIRNIASG